MATRLANAGKEHPAEPAPEPVHERDTEPINVLHNLQAGTSATIQWLTLAIILFGLAQRASVALHPYSGEALPPRYGDYEAQRHWMEITLAIPPAGWYVNGRDNDLDYWGLDYPPLSAYASYLFGRFVAAVEPAAVQLHTSRGHESARGRRAMRLTVLASDVFLFIPAVLLLVRTLYRTTFAHALATLAVVLTSPALILIDHAHFQYNNISLALFTLALLHFIRRNDAIAAVFLTSSIYFKQMSLYYVLPVFTLLQTRLFHLAKSRGLFHALAYAVRILSAIALTTLVVFAPWISSRELMAAVLARMFPTSRGLYEDKVANVWCTVSVILPVRKYLSQNGLLVVCTLATLVSSAPFCLALVRKPTPIRLLLSTSACALCAYLFSYQVHEKQILLPLLPALFAFPKAPRLVFWFSVVSMTSLFPLLLRERSYFAYVSTLLLHAVVFVMVFTQGLKPRQQTTTPSFIHSRKWQMWLCATATALSACLHMALVFVPPPEALPDLFVLANTAYACVHLCMLYLALLFTISNS